MSRTRAAAAAALVLTAGLLITAAAVRLDGPGRPAAVPIVNRGVFSTPSTARSAPASSTETRPSSTEARFVTGTRLALPRYGVNASVTSVSAPGGVLDIPRDPAVLGWWNGGSAPGSGRGAVVIAGHIDYAGVTGALAVIARLQPGDQVVVSRPHQAAVSYRVTGVRTFAKQAGLPPSLFDHGGPERLVLITCGGPFDSSTGNYEDNLVAYATRT